MSDQKVAIITAGGSGMGADSARALAADGFHVGVMSSSHDFFQKFLFAGPIIAKYE